nr:DUF397 domain-containing protein [Micromonospora sp. DSM 115978]
MSEFGRWRKSTRSDGGQECVEVSGALDGSAVRVRDSKTRTGPILTFSRHAWLRFVNGLASPR